MSDKYYINGRPMTEYEIERTREFEMRSRTAELTQRLEQAERDLAKAREIDTMMIAERNKLKADLQSAERERDAALAKLTFLEKRDADWVKRCNALEADTKAALARATASEECAKTWEQAQQLAALQRDDAAKKALENGMDAQEYKHHLVEAQNQADHWAKVAADEQLARGTAEKLELEALRQRDDLRARIEALAVSMAQGGQPGEASELRALLNPPKEETALDVLSEIADAWSDDPDLVPRLVKLRTLLEAASPAA